MRRAVRLSPKAGVGARFEVLTLSAAFVAQVLTFGLNSTSSLSKYARVRETEKSPTKVKNFAAPLLLLRHSYKFVGVVAERSVQTALP